MNCLEHSTAAGHRQSSGDDACEPEWRTHLPTQWRECVVTPLELNVHREYEIPASRMLGHDEDGVLCFYGHDYALARSRSDDDEEFYRVLEHGETVRAWRLRDGRWLRYRIEFRDDDSAAARGCYTLADFPPR